MHGGHPDSGLAQLPPTRVLQPQAHKRLEPRPDEGPGAHVPVLLLANVVHFNTEQLYSLVREAKVPEKLELDCNAVKTIQCTTYKYLSSVNSCFVGGKLPETI